MLILVVLAAGLAAIAYILWLEHKRELASSTLDHWMDGHVRRVKLRDEMQGITIEEALVSRGDALHAYFNELEVLAVGVNSGAMSTEVFDHLDGSQFIRAWGWAEPWVKARQRQHPTAWSEIEQLYNVLIERRKSDGRPLPDPLPRYLKNPVSFPMVADQNPSQSIDLTS